MESETKNRITSQIQSNRVFLYMKGSPDAPQCGFSAQAAAVLKHHEVEFGHFDVLTDPAIRQGIKDFSDWPTIPQLYVKGEFIGGCDIITEMHNNGELAKVLKED